MEEGYTFSYDDVKNLKQELEILGLENGNLPEGQKGRSPVMFETLEPPNEEKMEGGKPPEFE